MLLINLFFAEPLGGIVSKNSLSPKKNHIAKPMARATAMDPMTMPAMAPPLNPFPLLLLPLPPLPPGVEVGEMVGDRGVESVNIDVYLCM